ncbi:MAG TPA: XRE family transcriptional regulator [Steroidobacteraceae bacterium]|nr:XRE family transcriptional regulator [Steroidobacteraceae bacterium]
MDFHRVSVRHYNIKIRIVDILTMNQEKVVLEAVAANCGRLRKARLLTFDALAKRSGISKGMLVEIEQGRTNPSIAILCRMANAFGVGIGELLAQEEAKTRFVVHQRADGRDLWETRAGSRATLIDTVRIGGLAAEIWRWRLSPGEHYDGAAHPEGTTEFLSVLRGTLTADSANEAVTTRAGSTARFTADAPHRYANTGSVPCEFQMVVLEPVG